MRTPLLDLARPGFHQLCRAYFGLELSGLQNIPASGPLIITPNHQTYADERPAPAITLAGCSPHSNVVYRILDCLYASHVRVRNIEAEHLLESNH